MRRKIRVVALMLMVAWVASFAAAVEKPAAQQVQTTTGLVIGAQDVITASDAGGGHLSSGDILLTVLVVLAVFGLASIL